MTSRPIRVTSGKPIALTGCFNFSFPQQMGKPIPVVLVDSFVTREQIISNDRPSRRKVTKPVYHTKSATQAWAHARWFVSYDLARYTDVLDFGPEGLPPGSMPLVDDSPDIDKMIKEVQDKFIPEFSAALFLLEPLNPKKLIGLGNRIRKAVFSSGAIRSANIGGAKSIVKSFREDYDPSVKFDSPESAVLSYNLAYKPFIGDLQSIHARLTQWDLILDKFQEKLRKGIRKVSVRMFYSSGTYEFGEYVQKYDSSLKVTWGFRLTGNVPNRLRGPLSRFNFGISLQTVWEFIPLSFVIDYAVPIGAALDSGIEISDIRFLDSWTSWKFTTKVRTYKKVSPGVRSVYNGFASVFFLLPPKLQLISEREFSSFRREPGLFDKPDGVVIGKTFKPLSFTRGQNLAALATSFTKSFLNKKR